MELGQIIREKRGSETQESFGARLGVSKQAVSSWERNETPPQQRIMEELGIERVVEYRDLSAFVTSENVVTYSVKTEHPERVVEYGE